MGILLTLLLCLGAAALPARAASQRELNATQEALRSALNHTAAVAVVLDLRSGRLLASQHSQEAATLARSPGSTLKPFFLASAIEEHRIDAAATVACRRTLHIGKRDLACTHPAAIGAFDASQALAYSCNTYFAALATRLTPEQAVQILRGYGFAERPRLFALESPGSVRFPQSEDQLQLLVLGVEGVTVTPAQLAVAYRRLAAGFLSAPAVKRGLEGSVSYGMAHNAAVPGIVIAGKTGTASDPGEAWTHGWFGGIASHGDKEIVLVIYLPRGNGGDAAGLAQQFLRAWGAP
jgi:stage II sporulation protein D